MLKRFCLFTSIVLNGLMLAAQVPTLDQLEQTTKNIQAQTERHVQQLLQAYQTLDKTDSWEYDQQVDRIIHQLIQLKSNEAVKLCIIHLDSTCSFDFSVSSCPGNFYLNYLVSRGPNSLDAMLDYLKQEKLTAKQRETCIWYTGMVMGYLHGRDREAILKCGDEHVPKYGKTLIEPVVARALVTPPPCSR